MVGMDAVGMCVKEGLGVCVKEGLVVTSSRHV